MRRFDGVRAASIYALVDPREPEHVRYIGLTVIIVEKRRDGHVKQALRNRDDWHKSQWIRKLARAGVTPDAITLKHGTWTVEEMCALEVEAIAQYRAAGHRLTNMTDGGESTLGLPAEQRPSGDRSGQRHYPFSTQGHNNSRAKLTYDDGAKIVTAYETGSSYKQLAAEYDVSIGTILNVVRGRSPWTKEPVPDHVPIIRRSVSKEEARRKRAASVKRSWEDPEIRARRSEGIRHAWEAKHATSGRVRSSSGRMTSVTPNGRLCGVCNKPLIGRQRLYCSRQHSAQATQCWKYQRH